MNDSLNQKPQGAAGHRLARSLYVDQSFIVAELVIPIRELGEGLSPLGKFALETPHVRIG